MANELDKARRALEDARSRIAEWDRALEQARTERTTAEHAAPADPGELEEYADTYARAEGKIRAAEQGRKVAASTELEALEQMVRAGLEDARADAMAAVKAHTDHRRKLDALLAKVSELDGADYRAVTLDDLDTGTGLVPGMSVKASKAASLQGAVWEAEGKVDALAHVLEHHAVRASDLTTIPAEAREYVNAVQATGAESPASVQARAQAEVSRLEEERSREEQREADESDRKRLVSAGRAWPVRRRG